VLARRALYLGEMKQMVDGVQLVGRWGYHLTKEDEDRFWGKVDCTTTPDGCWEFTGCRHERDGYGLFSLNGRLRQATHIALELSGYLIPVEFLQVRHYVCDNPPCCRPSHLKIGTRQDNANDMTSKVRQARGERNGRAKLRGQKDADEIRHLYEVGGISQRALGRQFGIGQARISKILRGEGWKS